MTSRCEGTPLTLREAQTVGLPVVAPEVGGIGETMWHGRTGLLTTTRDAHELAYAVLRVLNDRRLRQSAAKHGPRLVAKRFDWRRNIGAIIALYRGKPRLANSIDRLIRQLYLLGKSIAGGWSG